MITENDVVIIPERYSKMSVSELRKEKEQLLEDFNTALTAGLHKTGEKKDSSWYVQTFGKNAKEIEMAIMIVSSMIHEKEGS